MGFRSCRLCIAVVALVTLTMQAKPVEAGGWSVYIYNCSHPAYGWQRSGIANEVDISQSAAVSAARRRQSQGVSYEKYQAFRGTAQTVRAAAPNCGGSTAQPTCMYRVYIYQSRAGSGWLGWYSSSSQARERAIAFVRVYGGRWYGPYSDCR